MTTTPRPEIADTEADILDGRLRRAAALVLGCYDHALSFDPPNFDATGRATTAVALWEILTGIEDSHEAIDYARHVVAEGVRG